MIKGLKAFMFLFSLVVTTPVFAQQEDVILKAMKDELNRSMTELSLKDHAKPFFIAYGINDLHAYSSYATLGAIIQSGEVPSRSKNVRILAGNYEFNDESLDNDLFTDASSGEISLPLGDDYFGIRRSLWITTDAVYKGAAKKYQKHVELLKEQNKTLADLPHRTFAQVPVVNLIVESSLPSVDYPKYDQYIKEISGVFRSYPQISFSGVFFTYAYGHRYFVNSEGTTVKTPYRIAVVQVNAGMKTAKGEFVQDQLTYYAFVPGELPDLAQALKETTALAEKLIRDSQSQPLTDDYVGPVLFMGESVAGIFENSLFSADESLNATNTIRTPNSYAQDFNSTLEAKVGKNIIDNSLTITAKPTLERFNNQPLLGSYFVDGEGVRPKDELVLVERGVLRQLLNDRSLTQPTQVANGHAEGAGVIDVSVSNGTTMKLLKEKLIRAAKEEGMDYALIVKDDPAARMGFVNVYKVSLDTGEEQLLRSARLENLSIRTIKKIEGASSDRQVIQSTGGNLISFIVPQGLLLNDITIVPAHMPYMEHETFVESPLKLKK